MTINVAVDSKILLVEPRFPIPAKSKNHSKFLPIGLLKLAAFYRNHGCQIQLNRGNYPSEFYPNHIFITSLFTYWSGFVKEAVDYYRCEYPKAKITVGGIYATLMPQHCKEYTNCDEVFIGQHDLAEQCQPAYDLVNVDYQIVHAMRGCLRTCNFCGIWRLEKQSYKTAAQLLTEINANKLVFYDNNFLANPNINDILIMLKDIRIGGRVVHTELQSGIDGRILEDKPYLAKMLRAARCSEIRLAWDFSYDQYSRVENWIEIVKSAGYNHRSIYVFMIYNWNYDFELMELKRQKCYEWNVQIADCRYRPLDSTFDHYNGRLYNQSVQDYFIHDCWSDIQIKQFRENVRRHNICVRYKIPWTNYSRRLENVNARKKQISLIA